jgi:hypothetical protein
MRHPLWREEEDVIYSYNCYCVFSGLSLSGPSPGELGTISYSLTLEWVPFLSPLNDSQGYGGSSVTPPFQTGLKSVTPTSHLRLLSMNCIENIFHHCITWIMKETSHFYRVERPLPSNGRCLKSPFSATDGSVTACLEVSVQHRVFTSQYIRV